MNKLKSINLVKYLKCIIGLCFLICFTSILSFIVNLNITNKGYSIFIEFKNAYGIREGTSLRMRGVDIGHVQNIKIDLNSILVLVYIQSQAILIPKNSIIETNQTGLLNDTVIDIIPLDILNQQYFAETHVLSKECYKSEIICHLNYLQGERGLNYDDLVRAATRISQRFDDPSFFNIFYLFLQNSIELSDELLNITLNTSSITSLFYNFLKHFLGGCL
nr:hypothetical protein [Cystoclonium purpureum f. stellatum]